MKIETRTTLPQAVLKRLEDVPTWEGVLQYDPLELQLDYPLTIYRIRRRRLKDNRVLKLRYPLKATLTDQRNTVKTSFTPQMRYRYHFKIKGKIFTLFRSHLTMLCIMGFAITDRRHWVIDHVNGDSSDDRPSNLQVISQSENVRKSELIMKMIYRRKEQKKQRIAKRHAQIETSKHSENEHTEQNDL